jgi:hypothetical protein
MIQWQQVSKGLFLHQIYCNQVKLENHNWKLVTINSKKTS